MRIPPLPHCRRKPRLAERDISESRDGILDPRLQLHILFAN
jgi:hypothetical protein